MLPASVLAQRRSREAHGTTFLSFETTLLLHSDVSVFNRKEKQKYTENVTSSSRGRFFITHSHRGFKFQNDQVHFLSFWESPTKLKNLRWINWMWGAREGTAFCKHCHVWVISVCLIRASWWVSLVCGCGRTPAQGWGHWRTVWGRHRLLTVEWVTSAGTDPACCSVHFALDPAHTSTNRNK